LTIPEPEKPHHARIRWTKRLLRFMPRRALFHKYPLIGRFASIARQRAHLWSFKSGHVRPAFYAGSILSLLPVMGVQLPLALVLSLVLRSNFMVLGGLQFITNPFTAAPIYYGTYQLGKSVVEAVRVDSKLVPAVAPAALPGEAHPPELRAAAVEPRAPESRPAHRLGHTVNALVVGGVITGTLLGLVLDFGYRLLRPPASGSTDPGRRPK
jgi:hypothetical protein